MDFGLSSRPDCQHFWAGRSPECVCVGSSGHIQTDGTRRNSSAARVSQGIKSYPRTTRLLDQPSWAVNSDANGGSGIALTARKIRLLGASALQSGPRRTVKLVARPTSVLICQPWTACDQVFISYLSSASDKHKCSPWPSRGLDVDLSWVDAGNSNKYGQNLCAIIGGSPGAGRQASGASLKSITEWW